MNGRGSRGGGGAGGGAASAAATPNASTSTAAGNPADLAGRAPDDNDWSTYFCTYAYLYHQVSFVEYRNYGERERERERERQKD